MNMINSQVGRIFSENEIIRKENFIKIVDLPNGNKEYWYKHGNKPCRCIYEVNPETQIIVGARFEGSESACALAL